VFPAAYFVDRAKKCLALAKRVRNPVLAQTLAERARVLTRTAPLTPCVVSSNAKTLTELKRDLQTLSPGMSLHLMMRDYIDLFCPPDAAWKASERLGEEFGCEAQLRTDGCIWFVKRDNS
jgi:hypothetical protein